MPESFCVVKFLFYILAYCMSPLKTCPACAASLYQPFRGGQVLHTDRTATLWLPNAALHGEVRIFRNATENFSRCKPPHSIFAFR